MKSSLGGPCALLLLTVLLNLTFPWQAHANGKDQLASVREAGPEDGKLCCSGVEPLLFHGDQLLGITGRAGIFKSHNEGARWARSMQGLVASNGVSPYVVSRCQAPSDPRIVYVLAGLGGAVTPFNGFFSSDDFGETWTRRGAVDPGAGFNTCTVDALDPRTVYIVGLDSNFTNTIWKSTDGGRTVQIFSPNLPACSLGAVFPRPGVLYVINVSGSSCAAVSTDGGVSFQQLPLPPDVFGSDVSPDGYSIFVETFAGTFRSIDRGASFAPVNGLPNGFFSFTLGFDPTDSSRIYATDGRLRVSTDGGASFVLLPASNDPRFLGPIDEMSVSPRGSLYIDTLAGIFRSDDRGKTFRSVLDGFRASSVQDLSFDADGKLLVGVGHTQTAFQQRHGLTFKPIGSTPDIVLDGFTNNGVAVAGSPIDPNVILVATNGQGLFRTVNGGHSWTLVAVFDGATLSSNSRMSFATGSRVYLVAPIQTQGLYRSDDAGGTFTHLASLPFGAIAVDPRNADVLYLGTYSSGDGLFKSVDGGLTLQDLGQPGAFSALAVDRRDPKIIYAGQRSGQVIRSLDAGNTFAPASAGLAGAGVHGLAQDANGTLFVWLRAGGLFASDDHAATWHAVDTGEALRRSGVEAGRGSLVAHPRRPGHLYLGNAGVIEIIVDGDEDSYE